MAKEEKAHVKMTVIHFETESDNDTLKENIRSIAHTIIKAISTNQKVVVTSKQLTTGSEDGETPEVIEEEMIQDDLSLESKDKDGQRKKGTFRQYRTPQTIDIDLTSGEMPLKVFIEQKNPDNENKKYLTIAYWFKKYKNIPDVSADHVYTCFRFMGWNVLADVTRPFRNMKGKQYGWINAGSTKGTYTINHVGENVIESMGANRK